MDNNSETVNEPNGDNDPQGSLQDLYDVSVELDVSGKLFVLSGPKGELELIIPMNGGEDYSAALSEIVEIIKNGLNQNKKWVTFNNSSFKGHEDKIADALRLVGYPVVLEKVLFGRVRLTVFLEEC